MPTSATTPETPAVPSAAAADEKMAKLQLEIVQLRQESTASATQQKELQSQLSKAKHTLGVYSSATLELMGTGSGDQLKKLAEENRSKRIKEAHGDATELLNTIQEWMPYAKTSAGKNALGSIDHNIRGFVAADKAVVGDENMLRDTMGTTRVLTAAKLWGEDMVSKERVKLVALQVKFTANLEELQAERAQRAAIEKKYTTLNRQVDLLEQNTNALKQPGFDVSSNRTMMRSMASASVPAQKTSNSLFGALLGGGGVSRVGEKRSLASTNAVGTPKPGDGAMIKESLPPQPKRARTLHYDGDLPILGSFSVSHISAANNPLRQFSLNVSDRFKQEGMSFRLSAGVQRFSESNAAPTPSASYGRF